MKEQTTQIADQQLAETTDLAYYVCPGFLESHQPAHDRICLASLFLRKRSGWPATLVRVLTVRISHHLICLGACYHI